MVLKLVICYIMQVEAFLAEESHQQVREPSVKSLKDEDLFVLDKVRS
jgi:hypothetical protein